MSCINVMFNRNGSFIMMQATSNMMWAELALKYTQKVGINVERDQPKFIFNSAELVIDSCKELSELGIRDSSRIEVVLGKDIIGA